MLVLFRYEIRVGCVGYGKLATLVTGGFTLFLGSSGQMGLFGLLDLLLA